MSSYELAKKIAAGDWNLSDQDKDSLSNYIGEIMRSNASRHQSAELIADIPYPLLEEVCQKHPDNNRHTIVGLLASAGRVDDTIRMRDTLKEKYLRGGRSNPYDYAAFAVDALKSNHFDAAKVFAAKAREFPDGELHVQRKVGGVLSDLLHKAITEDRVDIAKWALDNVDNNRTAHYSPSFMAAYGPGGNHFTDMENHIMRVLVHTRDYASREKVDFSQNEAYQYVLNFAVKQNPRIERELQRPLPWSLDTERSSFESRYDERWQNDQLRFQRQAMADDIARAAYDALGDAQRDFMDATRKGDVEAAQRALSGQDKSVQKATQKVEKKYRSQMAAVSLKGTLFTQGVNDMSREMTDWLLQEGEKETALKTLDDVGNQLIRKGEVSGAADILTEAKRIGGVEAFDSMPHSMRNLDFDGKGMLFGAVTFADIESATDRATCVALMNSAIRANLDKSIEGLSAQTKGNSLQLLLSMTPDERQLDKLPKQWSSALEAGLPKHELWQELGSGRQRWLEVFSNPAPDAKLENESPFKFSQKVYDAMLPVMRITCAMESAYEGDAARNAYKLAVLFSSAQEADRFLTAATTKWAEPDAKQPVHDALLFKIPENGTWDVNRWKDFVLQHGPKATQYLDLAPRIDHMLKESGEPFPTSPAVMGDVASRAHYMRGAENPEFARLALRMKLSEKAFDKALNVIELHPKTQDNLPDIRIDGAEIGFDKYYMEKLPAGDPLGLVLGKLTNCCQHIDGAGKDCAVHGATSENGAFYVWKHKTDGKMTANDNIVAQSWAWIGKNGELVLDSYERLSRDYNQLAQPFVETFAARVADDFADVRLGMGGNTPNLEAQRSPEPAKPVDYDGYRDSRQQYIIVAREHGKAKEHAEQPTSWANRIDKAAKQQKTAIHGV